MYLHAELDSADTMQLARLPASNRLRLAKRKNQKRFIIVLQLEPQMVLRDIATHTRYGNCSG
jgi:hypothetical protein